MCWSSMCQEYAAFSLQSVLSPALFSGFEIEVEACRRANQTRATPKVAMTRRICMHSYRDSVTVRIFIGASLNSRYAVCAVEPLQARKTIISFAGAHLL